MSKSAERTIDHDTIRKWVEDRNGRPATVKRTGSSDAPGILRIDFPGFSGEDTLEPVEWDAFFQTFEESELAFLYQDDTTSTFCKFVRRNEDDEE